MMKIIFIFLVWTSAFSAYIKKVLGLPQVYLVRKENTFTHWHGCLDAPLHHTTAFARDKCVSSTPHKLKWKRFNLDWSQTVQISVTYSTQKLCDYLPWLCGCCFHAQCSVKLTTFLLFISDAGVSGLDFQMSDFWDSRICQRCRASVNASKIHRVLQVHGVSLWVKKIYV